MASVSIPDDELRRKLLELGVEVGPITHTTRSIYERKLKDLQSKKKVTRRSVSGSLNATSRPSLLSFSSDESESENGRDFHKTSRKLRRRRQSHPNNSTENSDSPIHTNAYKIKPTSNSFMKTRSGMELTGYVNNHKATLPRHAQTGPAFNDTEASDSDAAEDLSLQNKTTHVSSFYGNNIYRNRYSETDSSFKVPQYTSGTILRQNYGNSTLLNHNLYNSNHSWWRKDGIQTPANDSSDALLQEQFNTTDDLSPNSNSHFISKVLLGVVVLFFVILGVLYVGVRNQESKGDLLSKKAEMPPAISNHLEEDVLFANQLRNRLRQHAGAFDCKYLGPLVNRSLAVVELRKFLKVGSEKFRNCLQKFLENPEWGVRIYNDTNEQITNIDDLNNAKWLESIGSEKSFFCRLKLAVSLVLFKLFLLLLGIIALGLLGFVVHWRWKAHQELKKQIYAMAENILEILQRHYEASLKNSDLPPFLAIPHVRDMLIPPSERKQKQELWEKAVKFLQDSESRVRTECQNVQGEDFLVWRWLQPPSPQDGVKKMKVWQGQAFENLDTGLNALPSSPTPCLKIRNMFDPDVEYGDNWHIHIQDAILEKCEGNNGIVHLKVDTSSREGCVYVKCSSPEAAGKVFRALHGWWFDGSLVTVRYLRLERYHERFPDAENAKTPLKPSNNKRLSLRSPVYQSSSET